MCRFRLIIATLVAVAMMAFGAAACTPEQVTQVEEFPAALLTGIGELIAFNLYFAILQAGCGNQSQHDCGP